MFSDAQQLGVTKRFLRDHPLQSAWLAGWWLGKRFPDFLFEGVDWPGGEKHVLANRSKQLCVFQSFLTCL